MNHYFNIRTLVCISAIVAALLIALVCNPSQAIALNPRCIISWNDWNQNNIRQPIYNENWVCANRWRAHCERYYHPTCPGCYIDVCYISENVFCRNYGCLFDPLGNMPLGGNEMVLPCDSSDTEIDWCQATGAAYAYACSVPVCMNCADPWPDSVLQKIDQDVATWLAGFPVIFNVHNFHCDCNAGGCSG